MLKIYLIAWFILLVSIYTCSAQSRVVIDCEVFGLKSDVVVGSDNTDSTIFEKSQKINPTYEHVLTLFNRPLLNMVFFDNNSNDLSSERYTILSSDSAKKFNEEWLNFRKMNDGIEAYRDVLNIIARRFLDLDNKIKNAGAKPTEVLFIFGYNNGVEAPPQDAKLLSETRARSVFNYFRDVWRIDTNRMKIIPGGLPPSNSTIKSSDSTDKLDAEADSRCVIISSSQDINTPPDPKSVPESGVFQYIETKEVEKSLKIGYKYPQYLMFLPRVISGAENVRSFVFKAEMNGKRLKDEEGGSDISEIDTIPSLKNPYMLDLAFADQDMFPDRDCYIKYSFEITKNDGKQQSFIDSVEVILSGTEKVNVDKTKIDDKDYKRRTYWTQLFNYNDKSLREVDKSQIQKIVKDPKNALSNSNTYITIEGYTDRRGDDDVNQKLSQARVDETLKEFKKYKQDPSFKAKPYDCHGFGENSGRLGATNSTPEGRAYNRTVRIRVQLLDDVDFR